MPFDRKRLVDLPREMSISSGGPLIELDRGWWKINQPIFRCRWLDKLGQPPHYFDCEFSYTGDTSSLVEAGSGNIYKQIAFGLDTPNICNVNYAIWRFRTNVPPHTDPDENTNLVFMQQKRNDGQSTTAECGNNGYTTITPDFSQSGPVVEPGTKHTFTALMTGSKPSYRMEIYADDILRWEGDIPDAPFTGTVELRTDNSIFEIRSRVKKWYPVRGIAA